MDHHDARGVDVVGVDKSFDDTHVLRAIDLRIDPGESLALLGPSGCGKTTLLRLIAGLDRPDAGSISIGGEPMAGNGSWIPPEKRNVGMVFQDWALFPHLSVAKNVGYGLDRDQRNNGRIEEALDMVGLGELGDRRPDTLSGGQQQRVALARAIAPRPSVLLLDEPFSNLDSALRVGVRTEVHRLLEQLGVTSIFVTHDQEEAFVLGDRVAVMKSGVIEQVGSPREIYQVPQSSWVARFVGDVNLVSGTGQGGVVETVLGTVPLANPGHGAIDVLMRPEDLVLSADGPHEVTLTEYYGPDTMVTVALVDGSELSVRVPARASWMKGDRVDVTYIGAAANAFA